MGRREQAREEAAFLRGDVGVDGRATEEKQDEAQVEQSKAREQFLRGKAYLGREFLTWLLWRSEAGEPLLSHEGADVTVLFAGRLALKGIAGEVTELTAKGAMAPYSELIRQALDRGLLIHSARLRVTHGEKDFEATVDSEFLDVRSAKLPELMSEEDDDRLKERLFLTEQLSAILDALLRQFLTLRASPRWRKTEVPALKAWLSEGGGVGATEKAQRVSGRKARAV
ncbi:MAG: hypothetical protein ACK4N5_11400 [Myxococcales bacterium]